MATHEILELGIRCAGFGQLALVIASLAIPRVLQWREQLTVLRPLIRQLFWTYGGYIWGTNLWFGLMSAFAPGALLDRHPLGAWVTAFITIYWLVRVGIQLFVHDREDLPSAPFVRTAEALLFLLFVSLTAVYGCAFAFQLGLLT